MRMYVTAKRVALGGILLALTQVCMALGSMIAVNTLFFLAGASFFVGIMIRELGLRAGAVFWVAAVLLGWFLAPDKFDVLTYGAMGLYLLVIEWIYRKMAKIPDWARRRSFFTASKFIVFNLIYLPAIAFFWKMLFTAKPSLNSVIAALIGGQIALVLYDRAYEYVVSKVWGNIRSHF